jgi:tRNA-Thr(GGU) m(6)t(6)A37 methyltransferase TsaA
MHWTFKPIGFIHSCYKEKFGIPRQPNLVTEAKAALHLTADHCAEGVFNKLEGFSHLWLTFVFHQTAEKGWKPTIRPPRLGGNQRVGVFASRSTHRPNPLGLSVVRLEGVEQKDQQCILHLSGVDLLHNTPVLDVKPYIPYADSIPDAKTAYANDKPETMAVSFSGLAREQCEQQALKLIAQGHRVDLERLIRQILQQDPRPAYQKKKTNNDRIYAMKLFNFDVRWVYEHGQITVTELLENEH